MSTKIQQTSKNYNTPVEITERTEAFLHAGQLTKKNWDAPIKRHRIIGAFIKVNKSREFLCSRNKVCSKKIMIYTNQL